MTQKSATKSAAVYIFTKCGSYFITKLDKCYYKVRQVLQSLTILLQSATGITKYVDCNKVRQNTFLNSKFVIDTIN